jgi:hypothetical protein
MGALLSASTTWEEAAQLIAGKEIVDYYCVRAQEAIVVKRPGRARVREVKSEHKNAVCKPEAARAASHPGRRCESVCVHQPEATFLPHMMAWAREASKQGSSCKPHVPAELTPELSPALPLSALERTGIRARQRDLYQRPRTSDHQVVAQVAHEYPPLVTALLQSGLPVRTVLDAGANAGFSYSRQKGGQTSLPDSAWSLASCHATRCELGVCSLPRVK